MPSAQIPLLDLLEKKRNGLALSNEEIEAFVHHVTQGSADDVQLGAMLMAIYLNGMTIEETSALTVAMTRSGDTLDWSSCSWKDRVVDKHSTGGVGDKISLMLAPVLACFGLKVPMISGRGLELTGGTLDKLESIPGFRVDLSSDEIRNALDRVGCVITGQTERLVPADKRMYACRGASLTVACLPLIVSSIVSKKYAENLQSLVLDVTCGDGMFNQTLEVAEKLANTMVDTCKNLGIKTTAFVTRMDTPRGRCVGNALEVIESVECMLGRGTQDLNELVCSYGAEILCLSGKCSDFVDGKSKILEKLKNGEALAKFKEMLRVQGVTEETASKVCSVNVRNVLPRAKHVTELKWKGPTGYVKSIKALPIAKVALAMGGGRMSKDDSIRQGVGVELVVQENDKLGSGNTWVKIYHDSALSENLIRLMENSLSVSKDQPIIKDLFHKTISSETKYD